MAEVIVTSQAGEAGMVITDGQGNKRYIPVVKTEPPVGYKAVCNIFVDPATGSMIVISEA